MVYCLDVGPRNGTQIYGELSGKYFLSFVSNYLCNLWGKSTKILGGRAWMGGPGQMPPATPASSRSGPQPGQCNSYSVEVKTMSDSLKKRHPKTTSNKDIKPKLWGHLKPQERVNLTIVCGLWCVCIQTLWRQGFCSDFSSHLRGMSAPNQVLIKAFGINECMHEHTGK